MFRLESTESQGAEWLRKCCFQRQLWHHAQTLMQVVYCLLLPCYRRDLRSDTLKAHFCSPAREGGRGFSAGKVECPRRHEYASWRAWKLGSSCVWLCQLSVDNHSKINQQVIVTVSALYTLYCITICFKMCMVLNIRIHARCMYTVCVYSDMCIMMNLKEGSITIYFKICMLFNIICA